MSKKTAPEVDLKPETVDELVEETMLPVEDGKKPKPKPGDGDYDWSKEYGTDDLFKHTLPNGKVVALKKFDGIFSKTWMYKIRHLKTNIDIELAAIDRGTCDAAKQLLDELDDDTDSDPISDLWDAWTGKADEGLTSGN